METFNIITRKDLIEALVSEQHVNARFIFKKIFNSMNNLEIRDYCMSKNKIFTPISSTEFMFKNN